MDMLALVSEGMARNVVAVPVHNAQFTAPLVAHSPLMYHRAPKYVYVEAPQVVQYQQVFPQGVGAVEQSHRPDHPVVRLAMKRDIAEDDKKSKRVVWRGFTEALSFTHLLKLKSAAEWKVCVVLRDLSAFVLTYFSQKNTNFHSPCGPKVGVRPTICCTIHAAGRIYVVHDTIVPSPAPPTPSQRRFTPAARGRHKTVKKYACFFYVNPHASFHPPSCPKGVAKKRGPAKRHPFQPEHGVLKRRLVRLGALAWNRQGSCWPTRG